MTLERFLFNELEKIAPGKYTLSNILERTPCTQSHLKGGPIRGGRGKDWNLACHTFPNGIKKIWCLYGCGLTVSSNNSDTRIEWAQMSRAFEDSSNRSSASELRPLRDPGKPRVATEADRQRIRDSEAAIQAIITERIKSGTATKDDFFHEEPHPDPRFRGEPNKSHDQIVKEAYDLVAKFTARRDAAEAASKGVQANLTCIDNEGVPALEPVKPKYAPIHFKQGLPASVGERTKIRKTQSRKRGKK